MPQLGQSLQCLGLSWSVYVGSLILSNWLIRTMPSLYMSGAWAQRSQKQDGYISFFCTLQNISIIVFIHLKSTLLILHIKFHLLAMRNITTLWNKITSYFFNRKPVLRLKKAGNWGDREGLMKDAIKLYYEKFMIYCFWSLAQRINDPISQPLLFDPSFLIYCLCPLLHSFCPLHKRWHTALLELIITHKMNR